MEQNNAIVDGTLLEVGEYYYIKHIHSNSEWKRYRVDRITPQGYAWCGTGIRTNGDYYIRKELPERSQIVTIARDAVLAFNNDLYYKDGVFTLLGEDLIKVFIMGYEYEKRA